MNPRSLRAALALAAAALSCAAAATVSTARASGAGDDPAALHEAASANDLRKAAALLDAGAPVDARGDYGRTPLHMAALGRSLEVAELLIEQGAAIDARDGFDWTPLHVALLADGDEGLGQDSLAIARKLLGRGASVDAETLVMGWRPLHLAAGSRSPAIVQALLERGADVNAPMRYGGLTPLHLALRQPGAKEIAALLREAGGVDGSSEASVPDLPLALSPSPAIPLVTPAPFDYRKVLRGSFTAPGADDRLIVMSVGYRQSFGETAVLHALVDKDGATHFLQLVPDPNDVYSIELAGLCRDAETGQDHAIYRVAPSGNCYSCEASNQYWHWDAARGQMVRGFDDLFMQLIVAVEEPDGEILGFTNERDLVTADGQCRWRETKAQIDAVEEAFGALRAPGEPALEEDSVPPFLPFRAIATEVAEEWLATLRANPQADVCNAFAREANYCAPEGEQPVVSDLSPRWIREGQQPIVHAGSPRWEVVHIELRGVNDYIGYDTGITLVHDMRLGGWRSILNCEHVDFHRLLGDVLLLEGYYGCVRHREHRTHRIRLDLSTLKADVIEDWLEWEELVNGPEGG